MKRILSVISLAATLLGAVACGDVLGIIEELGGDTSKLTEISITPASITIKAEGGQASIAFEAPTTWSVSSPENWLEFDPAIGTSGEVVVTITARENTGAERSATVTVESGKLKATATVIQEGVGGNTQPGDSTVVNPGTDPEKWYVCGTFTNTWDPASSIAMNTNGDGIYTLDIEIEPKAEFKFMKDQSWDVNLGATAADPVKAGETISLMAGGYNIIFNPGGRISVTLDINKNTALITGGNPEGQDPPQPQEAAWSVIGSINGTNWDTDFDMTKDGDLWKTTIYFRDGQEFKLRNNHEWVDDRGYGMVDPRNMTVAAVSKGSNITLPYSAYWDVVYDSVNELLSFAPSEDVQWQYFLDPSGQPAWIEFTQSFWEETAYGYIKYYEVDGIRTCRTETLKHMYNGEYYEGNGFWGLADAPGEGEWTFIWYADNNLIQLPAQFTGYHHSTYDADVWVYDMYAFYKYLGGYELGTWKDEATAPDTQFVSGYYDNNGGFYLNVFRYYMDGVGGYKIEADDIIGEAEGFNRHDYSGSINVDTPFDGARNITFTVGKDIASVRYVILDEKIDDEEKVSGILQQLLEGTVNYNTLDQFSTEDGKNFYGVIKYSAEVSGYHTIVSAGLDAAGNCYFWYYWWFYLDTPEDKSNFTWTSLGTGTYTDDFFTTFWNTGNQTWEVTVEQCDQDPTRIRMVYPYDAKYPYNEEGDYATDKSYDIEIMIPDNEHVYIVPQEIGVDWGYGMIRIASTGGYDIISAGLSIESMSPADFGTLSEGVISFPDRTLLISLADYNSGGWYFANTNSAFKLVLPGAETGGADGAGVAAVAKKSVKPAAGVLRMNERAGGNGKQLKPAAKKLAINRNSPVM